MEVAMVEAVLESRHGKLTNTVIAGFLDRWDLIGVSKGEVFIEYEADVSRRVNGVQWGVVDFGKLFTETNEQKFSPRGVSVRRFAVIQKENRFRAFWKWSVLESNESEGRKGRAECHLRKGNGLWNRRKWNYWEAWCTWRRVEDQGQSL